MVMMMLKIMMMTKIKTSLNNTVAKKTLASQKLAKLKKNRPQIQFSLHC